MKQLSARILAMVVWVVLMFATSQGFAQDAQGIWTDTHSLSAPSLFEIAPVSYRSLQLDQSALDRLLGKAPLQQPNGAITGNVRFSLPYPDGTMEEFIIAESSIMEPELAAKFPQIKTYAGRSVNDPSTTVHMDWTEKGFHAMIIGARGTVYIDPAHRELSTQYVSYFKQDARSLNPPQIKETDVIDDGRGAEIAALIAQGGGMMAPVGTQLRTYRVAIAATGEYTQFHGGTVSAGMSAIVTTLNRVNQVYQRDVSVKMVLVANNNLIVYTNAGSDPYANNNGGTMLGQNQSNIDAVIGNSNYDIGHVFSTGGGGVAYLGVPCVSGSKAGGVTGQSSPIGDPFDIDYVAHEMGHQFGAEHTFNGSSGSCSGGNRNASTAYEPGSGTTIMAYAGICSPQNTQPNSDDHFHTASYDEIVAYTTVGGGNSCPVKTNTGNTPPTPNAGSGGFTIPQKTPFKLTGSGSDPDGQSLTYNWEQYDLGPAGHPNTPSGNAPLFRSFPSKPTGERVFPQMSDIVNNTQTMGEILPTTTRPLTFRLTVRDGAGGVDRGQMAFSVTSNAGPFVVTAPNTSVTWVTNSTETVTWNVANTNVSPVNTSSVNILLSTDGGYTYPITLASGTPNDGSQAITVPNIPATTSARVKVEAIGNIFFDISNANFTIQEGGPPPPPPPPPPDFTITLLKRFFQPNGKKVAKIKWNPIEVNVGKIDIYVDEAPDGTYLRRTANDGVDKVKLGNGQFPGNGPYTIQACEKNSTTVCSNVLSVDWTGALIDLDEEDSEETEEGGKGAAEVPEAFSLRGNYPNPFNPVTTIQFDLPVSAEVSVAVLDLLGRTVLEVPSQQVSAGFGRGIQVDASRLASGTYLYQVKARTAQGLDVITGRMVLVK